MYYRGPLLNAPKLDAIVGIVNMSWRLEWSSRWPVPAMSSSEILQFNNLHSLSEPKVRHRCP
jgi:hypothetical protein